MHWAFWAFFSAGLGGIPPTRYFLFASSGRGYKQFVCAAVFPANPSNTEVKALPSAAGTAGKPAVPYLHVVGVSIMKTQLSNQQRFTLNTIDHAVFVC